MSSLGIPTLVTETATWQSYTTPLWTCGDVAIRSPNRHDLITKCCSFTNIIYTCSSSIVAFYETSVTSSFSTTNSCTFFPQKRILYLVFAIAKLYFSLHIHNSFYFLLIISLLSGDFGVDPNLGEEWCSNFLPHAIRRLPVWRMAPESASSWQYLFESDVW